MAPWRSELIDPHSFPRRNDTLSITDVGHLHELDVSRNRAYWAYSVRKPMKRMKIIVCTGRMVYMGG